MSTIADRPVNRAGNKYCGPLVVAAILGSSAGHVATLIANKRAVQKGVRLMTGAVKRTRNNTPDKIRGTYGVELMAILAEHGFAVEPIDVGARYQKVYSGHVNDSVTHSVRGAAPLLTTEEWRPWTMIRRSFKALWMLGSKFKSGTYIVNTPGHWALAHDGQWCETFTNGEWIPFARCPGSRRKVLQAWRVTRAADGVS
jgi:hypothetical protein